VEKPIGKFTGMIEGLSDKNIKRGVNDTTKKCEIAKRITSYSCGCFLQ
jgi:hypothetical protein